MRRILLLTAALSLASCNAINGFSDLEKVDCVEGCGSDATTDGLVADTGVEASGDTLDDTGTAPDDTTAPDADDDAVADAIDDGDASADAVSDAVDAPDAVDTGCAPGATQSCYSGPAGTLGKGACHAGVQHCIDGAFGPCIGQVVPTPESCNGVDDDCNGTVDDATDLGTISCGLGACKVTKPACAAGAPATCAPGAVVIESCDGVDNDCDGAIDEEGCACVHVAPTGNDSNLGSPSSPMRTINAAIARAVAGPTKRVCVASGATCPSSFDYAEAVAMKNGVAVYGGYRASGTAWSRLSTCTTRIVAQDARGVVFDATVVAPTSLDGFTVTGRNDPTNAAITVEGSTGAIVSNVTVLGGAGTTSIGIDVLESGEARATPTILRSAISGGTGAALSIGVRATRSSPVIQDNCPSFDANGRCNVADACAGTLTSFIRGRTSGSTSTRSYGVFLTDSPRAAILRSAVCSGGASTEANAVRVGGDLTLVKIANNSIHAMSAATSVGAYLDACADGAPSVFNNFEISAETSATSGRSDGVRVAGDCHARVDSNVTIVGNESASATADSNGVYCTRTSAGKASRCTVTANATILGTAGSAAAAIAAGLRCDEGACSKIERNTLIAGTSASAATTTGVVLSGSGTLVSGNVIESGCANKEGVGLFARDAFARIENTVLRGSSCMGASTAATYGLRAVIGAGRNELDVHSTTIFGLGAPGAACVARALALEVAAGATPGPRGLFRNVIFVGGPCSTSYIVDELSPFADPRVFTHNDLWPLSGTAMYRDEPGPGLNTIADINALTDGTFSSNLAVDPGFFLGFRLGGSSSCRDVGTMDGAPALDIDKDPRPQGAGFDLGADEYKP